MSARIVALAFVAPGIYLVFQWIFDLEPSTNNYLAGALFIAAVGLIAPILTWALDPAYFEDQSDGEDPSDPEQ